MAALSSLLQRRLLLLLLHLLLLLQLLLLLRCLLLLPLPLPQILPCELRQWHATASSTCSATTCCFEHRAQNGQHAAASSTCSATMCCFDCVQLQQARQLQLQWIRGEAAPDKTTD
jgi:hypothetical protein